MTLKLADELVGTIATMERTYAVMQQLAGRGFACRTESGRCLAACGSREFLDALTCLVFDPVADRLGDEHDYEVGFDRLAFVWYPT
jgi:hypothetical protein